MSAEGLTRQAIIEAAKTELARRRNTREFKAWVKQKILASLFAKQREVVDLLESGVRRVSLCCSRRAGKTNLLAKLIILRLLDARFNQAVFYVAPTLELGLQLIWSELERLVETYHLGWKMRPDKGWIETDAKAKFLILGLNKKGQVNKPRGFEALLFVTDESQEYEYLLKPLLTAVGPALSGSDGVFIAAGTPGHALMGDWYDICHGAKGFINKRWTVLENEMNPKPGWQVLEDEKALNGWTGDEPEYKREWEGLWVADTDRTVVHYNTENNAIFGEPDDYKIYDWERVIGIDYGHVHATAWSVLAVNRYTGDKVVVDFLKKSRMIGDDFVESTRALIERWGTTYVVCDPGGGGVGFFEAFNAKYGQQMGTIIRAANKMDKAGSIHFLNTELRTGRLKLLMPACTELANELQTLRYKNDKRDVSDLVSDPRYGDDGFDSLRYALRESIAWALKPEPPEGSQSQREKDLLARARALQAQRKAWWQE